MAVYEYNYLMDIKMKKIMTLLICACLVLSQSAFAARMGGGKSYGMQRSANTNSNYSPQPQAAPQATGQAPRQGMGAGTAAVLGAAAGAAGGYMLGKSMSNNASGGSVQSERSGAGIPWGTIGILGILLFLGLMLFRRSKANPGFFGNTNNGINPGPAQNSFKIPGINRDNNTQTANQSGNFQQAAPQVNTTRMPDGVEAMYFLRQVKGTFLHIQSMNNPDNVSEVEKYMTPNLYQEIKSNITANTYVADFSNLDCQLLDCETSNGQLIASVKFFGLVSEEPNQPAKPFSEIWNFVKPDMNANKWLVAGIQQETLA